MAEVLSLGTNIPVQFFEKKLLKREHSKEPRPSGRGFLEEVQLLNSSLLRLMKPTVLPDYVGGHLIPHRPNKIPSRISLALTAFSNPTTALIEYLGGKLRNRCT